MGKKYKKGERNNIWLKIHGKELWISPIGTYEEYFLTDKKITMEEIKNWRQQENKLL